MANSEIRKGLVLGLFLMFIGAGIIPSSVSIRQEITQIQKIGTHGFIQDLIDNASDGDTIYIPSGIYYENIFIDKSINLIGEDKNTTIIDANHTGNVINVYADWVNISRITIQNSGIELHNVGIEIQSNHCNISNSNIVKNLRGIISEGDCNTFTYNNISNNNGYPHGVGLAITGAYNLVFKNIISNNSANSHCCGMGVGGENNSIIANTITYNKNQGIIFDGSNITITENNISKNGYGGGIYLSHYSNLNRENTISGNNIKSNNGTGIYICWSKSDYYNISGNNISKNENGLIFEFGEHNIITGNNIYFNQRDGMVIDACSKSTIADNKITSNNDRGLYLYHSHSNNITDNKVISNNYHGVDLDGSNDNNIIGNIFSNNVRGFWFNGNNNTLLNNTFSNEGLNLYYNSYNNNAENNLVNDKPLIYLEDKSDIIIDDDAGQVILINCDNITVQNQEISNTIFAISLLESNNCNVFNNKINKNYLVESIRLYESTNNTIGHNTISENDVIGIKLLLSNSNSIVCNKIISNNQSGIEISYSNNNNITGNDIFANNKNGIFLEHSLYNIIINNIISEHERNPSIRLYKCKNINIISNNILNNNFGISLDDCEHSFIEYNNITNNEEYGIEVYEDCDYNDIIGNNINYNGYGIKLGGLTEKNIICHNNFINNTQNAVDGGDNMWDGGKFGNYWSDYEEKYPDAKKLPFKGIWDTPYEIEGGDNSDDCPLIKQWPKSRSITISKTRTITQLHPILQWLIGLFPMLERLLSLLLL
ncbi:MAG: right-handed parallel beta-helix repeat-containing protein [Thermoplasmatales archaeon]|nr:MAG: right-handed parallel beta-helix repeat-containing protein [Thermoplasmatales archaeon]